MPCNKVTWADILSHGKRKTERKKIDKNENFKVPALSSLNNRSKKELVEELYSIYNTLHEVLVASGHVQRSQSSELTISRDHIPLTYQNLKSIWSTRLL